MFKSVRLAVLIVILFVWICENGNSIHIEDCDTLNEVSVAVLSPAIVPTASPITYLDTSFFCYTSHIPTDGIGSIALVCSNGQTLETESWRQAQWLSFINGKTGKEEQLKIKASDCPLTLTLQYLIFTESNEKAKKRKRTDTVSTVINLSKDDLFYADGCPKGIELKLYTQDPSFSYLALGILRKGEKFSPSPWDTWNYRA